MLFFFLPTFPNIELCPYSQGFLPTLKSSMNQPFKLFEKNTSNMAGVHSCQILAGSSNLLLVVRYAGLVSVAAPGRKTRLRGWWGFYTGSLTGTIPQGSDM